MGWKHIVVEGHCFFGKSEANDNIPKCCKNGPGNIGIYCLDSGEGEQKRCKFFAYGKACSTLVLTDASGEEVAFDAFWSDEDRANNELWLKKVSAWIKNLKEKIDKGEF